MIKFRLYLRAHILLEGLVMSDGSFAASHEFLVLNKYYIDHREIIYCTTAVIIKDVSRNLYIIFY